jgi:hypothetical protein
MAEIKVTFPEPCSEPWEGMAPAGCRRHCATCDKVIHDLAAMTLDEAEGLLAAPDGACVRARIAPDGTVKTADGHRHNGRRLVAAASASMSFALAACQTPVIGEVSPRFAVTGETWSWYHARKTRLITADGRALQPALSEGGRLRFNNLKPGTYTLRYTDICGETHFGEPVSVTDSDVDFGKFEWEEECIIIGVMAPADDWRG